MLKAIKNNGFFSGKKKKKSHSDENNATSSTQLNAPATTSDTQIEDLYKLHRECKLLILEIKTCNEATQKKVDAHRMATDSEKREMIANTIARLGIKNAEHIKTVHQKLNEINDPKYLSSTNMAIPRIQSEINNAINYDFVPEMDAFVRIHHRDYALRKQLARTQYSVFHPEADADELKSIELKPIEEILSELQLVQERTNALQALAHIEAQNKDFLKIEASLKDLQFVFDMLYILVEAQAKLADSAQINIQAAKEDIHTAHGTIKQASRYQSMKH